MTKLVDELYKKPKRDKGHDAAYFHRYPPNTTHQADLLMLPFDKGYKYALVVTDIGSRLSDAEPIKNKESETVLKALKKIYKRGILEMPSSLEFDQGSEFKSVVTEYLEDNGVKIRRAKPYRHRQQAIVERKNQTIGTALHKRMTEEELQLGIPSTQWVDDLPELITNINDHVKKKKIPKINLVYIQI